METIFWWIRQVILSLAGCFFLIFGIHVLKAAYQLEDPGYFVMTFFASNLMILISATLLLGFVFRMVRAYKNSKDNQE
ncbi:MAG: hypothetical protein HQ561_01415 [Desulfobacteraceae bacterium]|nr:hypothetical protein [Desulfobacteraceae bacterium]